MRPKILLISTMPYEKNGSTRTLDSYFHYWEKENVAQIFSRNWVPPKGHCERLYQITDARMLARWFHQVKEPGRIFRYDELPQDTVHQSSSSSFIQRAYYMGTKHTPLIELLRRALWRKKYWCTQQFNDWLDEFRPDCVLYSFIDHIFTQQIALYVAQRFNIPIVTLIGDDYYFNDRFSLSPMYYLYRHIFKRLTRQILLRPGSSAVYCSNKIRDKYNAYFNLRGETVYFSSLLPRKPFKAINKENPVITYFGGLGLGRYRALMDMADALGQINKNYKLEVYSTLPTPTSYSELTSHPQVKFGGAIPYSQVAKRMKESDVVVVAEGFRKQDINFTRYSLSTKSADALACGCGILVYGPREAGVVEYLAGTKAATVCTSPASLGACINELFTDISMQKKHYEQAISVTQRNHTVQSSCKIFEQIISAALAKKKQRGNI